MRQKDLFNQLPFLYATPYAPLTGRLNAQDILGWMVKTRALQRTTFPMFTVLTGKRELAETLVLMVGYSNDSRLGEIKGSVNAFFRRFELLIALSRLAAAKSGVNETELLKGYLNSERFIRYWDDGRESEKFVVADDSASCMRNLGYGIAPHYWASVTNWGLVNRKRGELPSLTTAGKVLFKVLKTTAKGSNRDGVDKLLAGWFSRKPVSIELLKSCKTYLTPKEGTAVLNAWSAQADQLSRSLSDGDSVFCQVWHLLREHFSSEDAREAFSLELQRFRDNELKSEPFSTGALLRRWVEVKAREQKNRRLQQYFRSCRELELIGGISNFILLAADTEVRDLGSERMTTEQLARRWHKWLPEVHAFLRQHFSKVTDQDFKEVTAAESPKKLLDVLIERHCRKKQETKFLIKDADGFLQNTHRTAPKNQAADLLNVLMTGVVLPARETSGSAKDPWLGFTEFDFHWGRFALWMGLSVPGAADEEEADDGEE